MKNNRWIIGLVVVIAAIVVLSVWGFKKSENKNSQTQTANSSQGQSSEKYFSENASVMYFYQDTCSWCIKEKEVLQKLGDEGYRVKQMNISKNADLWQQYKINGTPTFVAKNGDRLDGYHDYDSLKTWLDQYK